MVRQRDVERPKSGILDRIDQHRLEELRHKKRSAVQGGVKNGAGRDTVLVVPHRAMTCVTVADSHLRTIKVRRCSSSPIFSTDPNLARRSTRRIVCKAAIGQYPRDAEQGTVTSHDRENIAARGPEGRRADMRVYHDEEWGVPQRDSRNVMGNA